MLEQVRVWLGQLELNKGWRFADASSWREEQAYASAQRELESVPPELIAQARAERAGQLRLEGVLT